MSENGKQKFIGKKCTLRLRDNFVLTGNCDDVDKDGIIFSTDQRTSFINWDDIRTLVILEDD